MISMINKNGDQPVPLGDRGPYYEHFDTNNSSKEEKGKTQDNHSNNLSAFLKIVQKIIIMAQELARRDPSLTMTVLITLRQMFCAVRIRPRPCPTLR